MSRESYRILYCCSCEERPCHNTNLEFQDIAAGHEYSLLQLDDYNFDEVQQKYPWTCIHFFHPTRYVLKYMLVFLFFCCFDCAAMI